MTEQRRRDPPGPTVGEPTPLAPEASLGRQAHLHWQSPYTPIMIAASRGSRSITARRLVMPDVTSRRRVAPNHACVISAQYSTNRPSVQTVHMV